MKLKYGDRIKVISGFYEGLLGVVSDYNSVELSYYVEMTNTICNQFTSFTAWIKETDLEKIEFHNGINNGSWGVI